MSKGAFLAVSFVSFTGAAGYVQMKSSMDKIITLQEKTVESIHSIDKRLTVVEHRLDDSIVFKSQPTTATRTHFDSDAKQQRADTIVIVP